MEYLDKAGFTSFWDFISQIFKKTDRSLSDLNISINDYIGSTQVDTLWDKHFGIENWATGITYKDWDPRKWSYMPIVLWDSKNSKKVVIDTSDYYLELYPKEQYMPIGIVVIPKYHTDKIYSNNFKRHDIMMSLKSMSYNTPDAGGNNNSIYWGGYGVDIFELFNYAKQPVIANNTASEEPSFSNSAVYIPSDKFSNVESKACPKTKYYNTNTNKCPSPYLYENGCMEPNPAYYLPWDSTSPSITSDFNGKQNTEILLSKITSQPNWRTDSTITNNSGSGYCPAAACCWRYSTPGTSQGDWYLPSIGELGYIMPFFNKINNTINRINQTYGAGTAVTLDSNYLYWSSTEYSSDYAYRLGTDNGSLRNGNKNLNSYVRAFAVV